MSYVLVGFISFIL